MPSPLTDQPASIRVDFGTPTVGEWCEICLLPSKEIWPLVLITAAGVRELGHATRCKKGPHA